MCASPFSVPNISTSIGRALQCAVFTSLTAVNCWGCGHVRSELPLSVREGTRAAFGAFPDYANADAVASLKNLAVTSMVSACGEEGHGARRKVRVKQASVKQGVRFIQL